MSTINLGQPTDRTFVYSGLFQVTDGTTNATFGFIQDWEFTPNIADFDIDRIDTAAPIFTKKSDILGSFSFNTKNTLDIYSTSSPPTTSQFFTVSFWSNEIAKGEPPTVTFFIKVAGLGVNVGSPNEVNYTFNGRIMDLSVTRTRDTGVHEVDVNGEITKITEVIRKNS